jgi:hypothetical protein
MRPATQSRPRNVEYLNFVLFNKLHYCLGSTQLRHRLRIKCDEWLSLPHTQLLRQDCPVVFAWSSHHFRMLAFAPASYLPPIGVALAGGVTWPKSYSVV